MSVWLSFWLSFQDFWRGLVLSYRLSQASSEEFWQPERTEEESTA